MCGDTSHSTTAKIKNIFLWITAFLTNFISEMPLVKLNFFKTLTIYNKTFTEKRTLSQHSVAESALRQHIEFAMSFRIPNSTNFR